MKKQVHVYYSGQVQGVGFRFTVSTIADNLGVWGWVKNLSDSRVEIVAEAEEEVLKGFLEKLREYFASHIRGEDIEWCQASGKFRDFGIEF